MRTKYVPLIEVRLLDTQQTYRLNIFYDNDKEWDIKGMHYIKELENKLYTTKANFGKIVDDIEFRCNEFGLEYRWVEVIETENKLI